MVESHKLFIAYACVTEFVVRLAFNIQGFLSQCCQGKRPPSCWSFSQPLSRVCAPPFEAVLRSRRSPLSPGCQSDVFLIPIFLKSEVSKSEVLKSEVSVRHFRFALAFAKGRLGSGQRPSRGVGGHGFFCALLLIPFSCLVLF